MARQEINLGAAPTGAGGDTTRSTGVKINAMTQELYAAAGLANSSGWGGVNPPVMPEGFDANTLTGTKLVLFNTGVNLPGSNSPYWFVENIDNGGGYMTQRAMKYTSPGVQVRQRHPTSGWSPWTGLVTAGEWGAKTPLPNANANTLFIEGSYSTTAEWVGSPFPGLNGQNQGWLTNRVWSQADGQYRGQTFRYLDDSLVGNTFERVCLAGVWRDWYQVTNARNIVGGVVGAVSGSVFQVGSSVTGWYQLDKGGLGTCTVSYGDRAMGVNEIFAVNVSLPMAFLTWKQAVVTASFVPTVTHDHYGTTTAYLSGPTSAIFGVRNGATAQTFQNIQVCVTGWWN